MVFSRAQLPAELRPSAEPPPPRKASPTRALLRAHLASLLVLVPLTLADVAIDGGLTLSYRFLIDHAILPRDERALALTLVALCAGVAVSSVLAVTRDRLYANKVAAVMAELRLAAYRRTLSLPAFARLGQSPSDLIARLTTDMGGVEAFVASAVHGLLVPLLSVVMGVVMLFVVLPPALAGASMLLLPLMLLGPRLIAPRAADAATSKKQAEAELLARENEAIVARRLIATYGLAAFAERRFGAALGVLTGRASRTAFLGYMVERSTVISVCVMQVCVVAAGALVALRGHVSVGSLVTFFSLYWNLGWSLVVLSRSGPAVVSAQASMARLDELLDAPQEPPDPPAASELAPLSDAVSFDNVWFAYPGRDPVLKAVSFTIARGEFVAVVGPSGSGKSTVLGLLARSFSPLGGKVLLDGHDIGRATAASLRRQMAVVFQDTYLFDGTIRENIEVGREGASAVEIEAAARAAEVHEVIEGLPGRYEARVGEGGTQLSGGQRQRLAIARAVLRDPALLLLDEATSALDPRAEAQINETLLREGRRRTTIFVTHRLAAAAAADRIVVLSEGRVAEQGTHAELLARRGVYATLWEKQNGFIVSDDGAMAQVTPERLRSIALLRPLDDALLARLSKQFVSMRAPSGQQVIVEGEPGELFYLIARGLVVVTRRGEHGEAVELARLGDGDQFGEVALLRDVPRGATVTTRTDCVFLTLNRAQFRALLAERPDLRATIERIAAERDEAEASERAEAETLSQG